MFKLIVEISIFTILFLIIISINTSLIMFVTQAIMLGTPKASCLAHKLSDLSRVPIYLSMFYINSNN